MYKLWRNNRDSLASSQWILGTYQLHSYMIIGMESFGLFMPASNDMFADVFDRGVGMVANSLWLDLTLLKA